jgi:hypothetical protein
VNRCSSCDREIVFARTRLGRLTPVDLEPAGDGSVHLVQRDGVLFADVLGKERLEEAWRLGLVLHRPHWQTCTDPDRYRRFR